MLIGEAGTTENHGALVPILEFLDTQAGNCWLTVFRRGKPESASLPTPSHSPPSNFHNR